MFIVTAERDEVMNLDNVISVRVENNRIIAVTRVDDCFIGTYGSSERAKEVFKDMLNTVFPPLVIFKNCTPDEEWGKISKFRNESITIRGEGEASVEFSNCGVYYMPEE